MKKVLGRQTATQRGFPLLNFNDCYDHPCSLQASSLAIHQEPGTSAVWLGCDNADPKIMARDAAANGIKTDQTTGWVPYPISEDVQFTTRMHLDREQVASLIVHLQSWLKRGQFE